MKEQLTAHTTRRHTNDMEERGEKVIPTEVGKVIDKADALAHGLELLGQKIKESTKKSKEDEKEAERKIREELERERKAEVSILESQEKKLAKTISKLPKDEQLAYRRMFESTQDPKKRDSLLKSIHSLVQEENISQPTQETDTLTVDEVHDEDTLNSYLKRKVSPQIDLLKQNAIEHIRGEGVGHIALEELSQDIDSAFHKEKERLQKIAEKEDWERVVAYLKQIESDISIRLKHFDKSDAHTGTIDSMSKEDTDKDKKTQSGDLAKELLDAEVKQHVAAAADRFKKGEEKMTSDIVSEPKGKLEIDPQIVYENASLTTEQDPIRLERAEKILDKSLTESEKEAILEAHYYGSSEDGSNEKSVYNYSVTDLRHKYEILSSAGLNKDQIRTLMEYGITGSLPNTLDIPQSVNDLLKTIPYVSNGQLPYTDHRRQESVGRATYFKYGGMEDYYSFDNLEKQSAEIVQKQTGRTIIDDVSELEDGGEYQFDPHIPMSPLQEEINNPQTFSIKGFNRRFLGELHRLHTISTGLPNDTQESLNSRIERMGKGLQTLHTFQERRTALEHELSGLRDQYSLSGGSVEVQGKINNLEAQLTRLESQFRSMSLPLVRQLDEATQAAYSYALSQKSKSENKRNSRKGRAHSDRSNFGGSTGKDGGNNGVTGGGGNENSNYFEGGAGRWGADGGEQEPPGGAKRLRGRGEGEEAEEDPFGTSVRSIEDLGFFMERVTAEFKGKIMVSVYRGKDNTVISEDQLLDLAKKEGIVDIEKFKQERKLYAYKVSQGEYARDYDELKIKPGQEGKNKVLMLTKDEIVKEYYETEKRILARDKDGNVVKAESVGEFKARIGVRPPGQSPKEYWESVQLVRPDEFMNWIRHYWTIVHGDDPDNPSMNFFSEIVVNHPDQRGAVTAGQMHKNAGAFLRSRFLTDPDTGELRVFEKLKDEIINEVWVPSGERNKEIFYKKVMHSDEELPKQVANQITADNLMGKTAAGGKNTMEMFFTLPERFTLDFDPITGETIPESLRNEDIGFGRGMLLAYEIYYNISDIGGLQNLLGKDASIFSRDFIARAVLEVIGSDMPDDLNSFVLDENGNSLGYNYYELARKHLLVTDEEEKGTIIDEELYAGDRLKIYDENGNIQIKNNPTLRKWLVHLNPYYPAQKDDILLNVIRKVVENQMQEITGIEKNPETSGLAEFHAYYRTYHDGIASRHDIGMGNRNSQSKYEFLGAPGGYQDKQLKRDRAGNLYVKGIIWGPTVGVLNAMPTRNGETVHDILSTAVRTQLKAGEEYRSFLHKAKRGELGVDIDQITQRLSSQNPQDIEGDPETNKILHEIRILDKAVEELKEKKMGTLIKQKSRLRYTLVQKALETRLRNELVCKELSDAWKNFEDKKDTAYKTSSEILARLRFDEVQYAQYGGMHYNNSTALFHMIMNSQDLPMDKIAGRDYEGKVYFKPSEFGSWLEESEKRMRYTIETWPLPLGSMIRKLVNPRKDNEVPRYVDMPVIESVFGSYDYTGARNGGVMRMAQIAINRELKKKGRDPVMFTDGKGNIVPVEPIIDEKTGEFVRDELGNIEMDPQWESSQALINRDNLRDLVGYIHYGKDNEIIGYQKGILDDPAKYFTRAFVKVQIADHIMSHTDKASPYEKWTVHQREEFFHALELSNYFSEEDIEDIREFSDNEYWKNFRRETSRSLRKEGLKGLMEAFKFFFSSSFK